MSRNGAGSNTPGSADEDVEPLVAPDDVGDEILGPVDLPEIRDVSRGGGAKALDRRSQLTVRKVHARHLGTGVDECLGAGQADAPLGARDEGDTPVEPPRPRGDGRSDAHRRAMTASISTGMSNGRCGTPTDVRAPRLSRP